MISGPYQEPDWIDRPVWTPEEQERARLAQEKRREAEWLNQQRDYGWYVGVNYGGTE